MHAHKGKDHAWMIVGAHPGWLLLFSVQVALARNARDSVFTELWHWEEVLSPPPLPEDMNEMKFSAPQQ